MKILLIGNYSADHLVSMNRFLDMLSNELIKRNVNVTIVRPEVIIGGSPSTIITKYLAYIDKLILFPFILLFSLLLNNRIKPDLVHIIDHSNSFYSFLFPFKPVIITGHDAGAIHGAQGFVPDCTSSLLGKWLQKLIVCGLKNCDQIACVSNFTKKQYHNILGEKHSVKLNVIYNGYNHERESVSQNDKYIVLRKHKLLETPYLLNVSSGLKRKNRKTVIEVWLKCLEQWPELHCVFAGAKLDERLKSLLPHNELLNQVVEAVSISDKEMVVLYQNAHALLFPSTFEGFGWPVIEAQRFSCPVICSNAASLPEVGGEGAVYKNPHDVSGFCSIVLGLRESHKRQSLIEKGLVNSKRFDTSKMTDEYMRLYRSMIN